MLQKSGRLVLWEAMFILELHSAETQAFDIFVTVHSYLVPPSNLPLAASLDAWQVMVRTKLEITSLSALLKSCSYAA